MALKLSIRFFLFFIFSALLGSCSEEDAQWSSEDEVALSRWLDEQHSSPGDIIREVLQEGRSIVLCQENAMRADTVDLIKALVPVFVDNGLYDLSLFFVNHSGNFRIDPSLAYSDYDDFLSYLEEFNQLLATKDNSLTWRGLRGQGQVSITALKSALQNTVGNNSVFIWIEKEDLTTYFKLIEDMESKESKESEFSPPLLLAHHGPEDERWEGLFDVVLTDLNRKQKTFAFYSDNPAFPGFQNRAELRGEVIYVVTQFPYRGVTPVKNFISSTNSEMAITYFQNLSIRNPKWWSSWLMNQFLRRQANKYDNLVSRKQKNGLYEQSD